MRSTLWNSRSWCFGHCLHILFKDIDIFQFVTYCIKPVRFQSAKAPRVGYRVVTFTWLSNDKYAQKWKFLRWIFSAAEIACLDNKQPNKPDHPRQFSCSCGVPRSWETSIQFHALLETWYRINWINWINHMKFVRSAGWYWLHPVGSCYTIDFNKKIPALRGTFLWTETVPLIKSQLYYKPIKGSILSAPSPTLNFTGCLREGEPLLLASPKHS